MSETIAQTQTRLATFIKNSYPDADVGPGSVLSELVVKLASTIQYELYNQVNTLSQSSSVQAALASTEDTFNSSIDAIASNYNVVRNQGRKVAGQLKIQVSTDRYYAVSSGTQFYQPAIDTYFQTTANYTVSSTPTGTDIQLYNQNGIYYFVVPIEAVDVGSTAQVANGATFQLAAGYSFQDFVLATAYGSFSSGANLETDKELISRFKTGLSTNCLVSQQSILSTLQTQYPGFQKVSVVGAGDAEMLRSSRNALGISSLGMADVYVRSSVGAETITFQKEATKIATGQWRMTLGSTDFPGFYSVQSIQDRLAVTTGSLTILTNTFNYSVPTLQRTNQVNTAQDARFTVYQTATVTFAYTESPTVLVGATQTFNVTVLRQPYLSEIQDLFLADTTRIACADYLAKGVVPCFVTVNLKLYKKNSTDVIPVTSIKQDIFDYINTIPLGESLYASRIVSICHKYSIKQVDLPIQLTGDILAPNGTTITLMDNDLLQIPNNPAIGVSNKTTMFFIDYNTATGSDNIGITVS